MELGLAGKTVIVAGGASNIGHGVVLAFAKEGANVVVGDIDEPQARRTARLAQGLGAKALAQRTDVTKPEQCEAMVQAALDEFGHVDVLVNNAGPGPCFGYFRDHPREDAVKVFDVNFWGTFNCTKAVLEHMIAQKSGSIVNTTSNGVYDPHTIGYSTYCAAKAAVTAHSQGLAKEVTQYGIRVNIVCPGYIGPERIEEVGEKSFHYNTEQPGSLRASLGYLSGEERAKRLAILPMGRIGHPAEIAKMVVFLASDAASYITGQVVRVNGGTTMAG